MERRLVTQIVAHLSRDLRCKISQLIVPDGWESTCVTTESMLYCEGFAAYTVAGYFGGLAVVSKA